MTFVLVPVVWLTGFCFGLLGSNPSQAAMKATACTLSGIVGCCVYLLVWWPKYFFEFPWFGFTTMSTAMVLGMAPAWPFLSRLGYGVGFTSAFALVMALTQRLWSRWDEWARVREGERAARPPERLKCPEPPPPVVRSDFEPAIRQAGAR